MNLLTKNRSFSARRSGLVWAAALGWTLILAVSLVWDHLYRHQEIAEVAQDQARLMFEKDAAYWRWNAGHGGVYVPVTDKTRPNPELEVPERDLSTPSGRRLTLLSPAAMIREVQAKERERSGVRARVSSLRPLGAAEGADPWEAAALRAFKRGETEVSGIERLEGEGYLRLMRPLRMEQGCLKCHGSEGVPVGEIRGGISTAVPLAPLEALRRARDLLMGLFHGLVWLAGLGGLGFAAHRLQVRLGERERAEAALRERNEFIETVLDHLPLGLAVHTEDTGRVMYRNTRCEEIYGWPPEILSEVDSFYEHAFPDPVYRRELRRKIVSDLESGEPARTRWENVRITTQRGETKIVTLVNIPLPRQNLMISTVQDVTERRRAEERLRQSEKRYRELYEGSRDGYVMVDQEGRITEFNATYQEMLGYPEEELLELTVEDITPEKWHAAEAEVRAKQVLERGYSDVYEKEYRRKDGSVFPIEIRSYLLEDEAGRPTGRWAFVRDVTARKEAEAALRESEEQHQRLLETTEEGVWIIDAEYKTTFVNPKMAAMLGYSVEEMQGRPFFDFADEKVQALARKTLNGRYKGTYEVKLLRQDGTELWTVLSTNPILDSEGRYAGALAMITDNTERKRAEETLRESEERYRTILESMEEGYYEVDLAGTVTFANESFCQITGYPLEELLGLNYREFTPPEKSEEEYRAFNRVYRTGEPATLVDFALIRKDGSSRVLEISVSLIRDAAEEPTGFRGVVRDVTARKEAEEALRESEKRYRAVLDASPDPVVVYDMEGKVTYFNPAFTRVFGWSLEERRGKKMDLFVPEENWPETQSFIDGIKAGQRIFSAVPSRRYTRDGRIIEVSITAAVYQDAEGRPQGSVVNLRDTTEQKKLEAQLQQAQKMEALGTLAGGITHDFNNLLMGIQGRASLLLLGLEPSHAHYDDLKGIEDLVQRGADLTRQLLGFARGGKYEVRPTNLNEVVRHTAQTFGRTKKEIEIYEKYDEDLWAVEVDRSQIEQVLMNLYVNAWQAMPSGGALYLETANAVLDESYLKPYQVVPGRYVKVSVTDTGVGMDEETQRRLFEPFFTTKEMGRGTGLGLASAYGIVKNHGGLINVYSQKGEGTTFTLYFPASEKAVQPEAGPSPEIVRGRETILVVDDEEPILEVAANIMESLGYRVLVAESGQAAVEVYKRNWEKIDLVVLDLVMPGLGGGEVFDRLREINPEVRVILSSGYALNGQAAEIMARGCRGFIQKPFGVAALSQKIREVLDEPEGSGA